MIHCGSSNLTLSVTFPGGEWPSAHVLRTLWREGNKSSYCFDSHSDRKTLLFQMPAWKTMIPQNIVRLLISPERKPWSETTNRPLPILGAKRPHRAASSHQHCQSAGSSYPCYPHWVTCRDKDKATAANFCHMGSVSPPPQSFSVISIELICTITLQYILEGTAGFQHPSSFSF